MINVFFCLIETSLPSSPAEPDDKASGNDHERNDKNDQDTEDTRVCDAVISHLEALRRDGNIICTVQIRCDRIHEQRKVF